MLGFHTTKEFTLIASMVKFDGNRPRGLPDSDKRANSTHTKRISQLTFALARQPSTIYAAQDCIYHGFVGYFETVLFCLPLNL